MVDALAAGPQKYIPANYVIKDFIDQGKVVEMPAEDKAKFERNLASAAASEAHFEAW